MVESHAVPADPRSVTDVLPVAEDDGLVRVLGLRSGVLFVLGSVIGSGIFLTTGVMASSLPSASSLLLAWATGGLLALTASRATPQWAPVIPPVPHPLAAFGVAMIAVLWTNDAWYCVAWIAGEMKNPKRDLPRSLVYGIGLLTVIYLAVNLAYFYAL